MSLRQTVGKYAMPDGMFLCSCGTTPTIRTREITGLTDGATMILDIHVFCGKCKTTFQYSDRPLGAVYPGLPVCLEDMVREWNEYISTKEHPCPTK